MRSIVLFPLRLLLLILSCLCSTLLQVCNCDAVLWFWATYESAQYCLLARLRTPLGMPAETFTAIESKPLLVYFSSSFLTIFIYNHVMSSRVKPYSFTYYLFLPHLFLNNVILSSCCLLPPAVLRGYAQEVESRDRRHLRDTPSSFSGHMGAGGCGLRKS